MAHNYSRAHGSPAAEQLLSPDAPHHGPGVDSPHLAAIAPPPTPRKRYWMRTLVLLAVPIAVTGYFYWIWLYLLNRDIDQAVKYGSRTEIWVYYSWFIIGVFALDWSKHGLVGVEVAMLESSTFRTPHLIGLLSHSEGTWGGPGGWIKAFKKFIQGGNVGALGSSLSAYRLWYLLAFLSLSLYVGLPLSGLTMELSDGYVRLDEPPMVVGRNQSDFHNRYKINGEIDSAKPETAWKMGAPPTLPGIGVIFTPGDVKREEYDALGELPNTLPTETAVPEMFIVPQATVPITGTSWGMRVSYNCSIVEDASDFSILGTYKGGSCLGKSGSGECAHAHLVDKSTNVWSYKEIGARMLSVMEPNKTRVYGSSYDGTEPDAFGPSDDSQADIIELALWQVRKQAAYAEGEINDFNSTIGTVIRDFPSPFTKVDNGSFIVNATFFDQKNYTKTIKNEVWNTMVQGQPKNFTSRQTLEVASAIGVQCVVKSTLGSASVDAATSTFSSFKKEYPVEYNDPSVNAAVPLGRLGADVETFVARSSLEDIFTSINARVTRSATNAVSITKFVSADDLQKSMWVAYGKELLEKMYDGLYGFEGSWEHANLISSKKGKVLMPGELSPLVSVIPFGIWAVGSIVLAFVYGFRKRLSDSLSGFSFFRFGVYVADELKASEGLFTATEAEEVKELWHLPGSLETMQSIPLRSVATSTQKLQEGPVYYDPVKEPEVRTTGY